ncbi:MAG: glycosyl hydrolase [Cyclobacteriaceae bacterium]|nr:glycosyl hydrolase [Cyclobacteriaceae bacterium]MCB0500945.1 glycosyl hydrolase [Cyclobacteriaceae bacterium]MCB9238425.1 glycosyl hydrolase [Flammeovirgaceae bacterium]MCO5271280.1 glycosyl hydrolase [Cyclobacteriaceae bacterium]MCW5903912.1 glycosyl hydrolase [Cyclobacteriaceae bacterium]
MKKLFLLLSVTLLMATATEAQRRRGGSPPAKNTTTYDEKLYNALEWRSIGPYRGGRSSAVTGVPGKPLLFYMGATGGGVWRTQDGGNSWENISDGYFGGSIGSVAVSEWDNNVIYVGGGEATVRGNVSSGYGLWKSTDAGKTWSDIGLKNSRHVPRIRIHPRNPDLVYAAVLGDLFKPSADRGVYRSKDGGKTWEKILFANDNAGAVDLILDPNNPRIIYASTWRIKRTPYSLESGGEGSALWKSTDGGDNWTNISANKGLPKGIWGIVGVTVSPVNSNRVYAIIENDKGGVYRSDDGGETWNHVNDERKLRQRAWYYSKIYADTKDEDIVYVMNVQYHRSKDGGKTFETYNAPHGDHHDLWIAPEDNQRMVIADDGGAQVSYDAGENWTTYMNQPTAQYYRVTTDNHFPYRILGAQQDNSTQRVLHRSDGYSISERDWDVSAGGESGFLAVDPTNDDIVYGGSYGGTLERLNHQTKESRSINAWPDNPMGHGAEGAKYRFQWNFPLFFSPHNPKKLYAASQHLHVTYNEGQSWELLSPDLTRNDPTKLGPSGGPITKDNTGVEYYATIFAAMESPYEENVIMVGSDDGLVHITKDGGKNWENVTPPMMPEWSMVNSVDFDPHQKGAAYIAATRYKLGDYRPYLYKTKDYGKTWTQITDGIPSEHFTRVVRVDPKRAGLLYAGTEAGMYISFDDGASWKPFQLNLPIVPITDLTIKNDNLIAATQGRSFWLIDDITPLHQLNDEVAASNAHLFKPLASYRMNGGQGGGYMPVPKDEGKNHPNGVMVYYYLKDTAKTTASLEIMEMNGKVIKKFATKPDKKAKEEPLKIKPGMNLQLWNMRYPNAEGFDGLIMWGASLRGPKAVPGKYKAKLTVNGNAMETEFEILKDPRTQGTIADIQEQFNFAIKVRDKLSDANMAVKKIRDARDQINRVIEPMKDKPEFKDVNDMAKSILDNVKDVEEDLYQTKNRSGQDPLNFPIRLNNKVGGLGGEVEGNDFKPTDQAKAVFDELSGKIDTQLKTLNTIFTEQIPEFNNLIRQKEVKPVVVQ